MHIIHNKALLHHIGPCYTSQAMNTLQSFLDQKATFEFPMLPTGLFAAARLTSENQYTGYDNVWIRDNVHVAHAHYVTGKTQSAVRTLQRTSLLLAAPFASVPQYHPGRR